MTNINEIEAEEAVRRMGPVSAPDAEQEAVTEFSAFLDRVAKSPTNHFPKCVLAGPLGEKMELPPSIFYVLERVAEVMGRGDAITVVPIGRELTTQQAAALLNVSRQYLIRLLDAGAIPFNKTGTHRRLKIEDVLDYKRARDAERRTHLKTLTQLSENYGGYEELK